MAEQIRVARHEDDQVELLGLERDADGALRRVQAQREDDDRDDVAHVSAEAKEIHLLFWRTVRLHLTRYIFRLIDGVAL